MEFSNLHVTLSAVQSDYILDSYSIDDTKYEITSCYLTNKQASLIAKIIENMPQEITLSNDYVKSSEELKELIYIFRSFEVSKKGAGGSFYVGSPIQEVASSPLESPTSLRIRYGRKELIEILVKALRVNR